MKQVNLLDIFSESTIEEALKVELGQGTKTHDSFKAIVKPLMVSIDSKTGQKNNLGYWSYSLEYLVTTLKEERKGL